MLVMALKGRKSRGFLKAQTMPGLRK